MNFLKIFQKYLIDKKKILLYPLLFALILFTVLGFLSEGSEFLPVVYSIF
jgi:hypothetical protein